MFRGTTRKPIARGGSAVFQPKPNGEFAARGGLVGKRYPWGDELEPEGRPRCNIWQGDFPRSTTADWGVGPVRANAFEPNAFGFYNMCGNVWEWCVDAFSPDYHAVTY